MKPTSQTVPAELAPSARWALASLSLSMLMPSLDTSIANVGLPTLAQAFSTPFQQVQWIVLAYLLAITTLIVGAGRLGDLIGRKRLLLAGIGLFTAASLACGLAPSLWALIAGRAVQGLGAATMMALTGALVTGTVPMERTGSAMGLLGTMSAIGTMLGPTLGGLLIFGIGWRTIFLVNVPLGLLNILLARRFLPADPLPGKAERARFDIAGTLLLALTLAAYALAMTMGHGRFGLLNLGLLLAAVCGGGMFALAESKAASPLLRLALFRDPQLSSSLGMSVLVMTVMMATLVVGPFYLSRGLGLDAAHVGLTMSAGPLVSALSGVPAGRLVDRFGAQRMTLLGLGGMIVGLISLCSLAGSYGIAGYIAPIVTITANYALFQATNNTAVMSSIQPDQRGVISGMLSLSRNLGMITGTAAMGALFAWATATSELASVASAAAVTGLQATFSVAVLLIMAAFAAAIAAYRRGLRQQALYFR